MGERPPAPRLRVVLLQPSKYARDGYVERFRWGYIPNSGLRHIRALTPDACAGRGLEIHAVDEYVQTDLRYVELLDGRRRPTLVALVGVQSHQLHRALDLAAHARSQGALAIVGGPHAMTCDTTMLQGRGVSFALAEAERVWPEVLADAVAGGLRPVYGAEGRWQTTLAPPPLVPPPVADLQRYVFRLLGVHPARGCPFRCNFCSIIKISGRRIRSQPVETTLASLRAAREAGVRSILFTTDNFNKYPEATELLQQMIEQRIGLPFYVQCDVQVARQPELIELLGRAGCYQIFLGVESFNRTTLERAGKRHNRPELYGQIARLCAEHGIISEFSSIIGFPDDTEAGVLEHLRLLRGARPDVASFWILTPVPGTEQYDDFLARGLIHEPNLDRYDGSCAVWRHPRLDAARLRELLFRCYREFYELRDVLRKSARRWRRSGPISRGTVLAGIPLQSGFSRWAARGGHHPMSGGIGRRRLDRAADYRALRQALYGLELVPLPRSLPLTAGDLELR